MKLLTSLIILLCMSKILCETDENLQLISKEIREIFKQHEKCKIQLFFLNFFLVVEIPLADDELLCKCNTPGCDEEITEIANNSYSGICRAHKNGLCRNYKQKNKYGRIISYLQECVLEADKIPPSRPFICENNMKNMWRQEIYCCSNESFCNYEILIQIEDPPNVDGQSFYICMLFFVVATVFSAVGLYVGIFWCRGGKLKKWNILKNRTLTTELTPFMSGSSKCKIKDKNGLDQLLDDLEMSTSMGSGSGMPLLAQRTIARQVVLKECIGRGRFGEVFLGVWRSEKVAVKIFLSRDEDSWRRETEIYRTDMLRHQNILRWFASDNKDTGTSIQLWLITEYLSNGSLYDYLEQREMTMVLCVQFIRSIAHGLAYLHTELPGVKDGCVKPGIAHRDLKTRNILIKNDMTCAIADLGMAVRCENGVIDLPKHTRGGTARYLAPEFLMNTYVENNFTSYLQMDIYALALVMWEISRRVRFTTKCGQIDSQPYQVPYYEYVDREPDIDEMRKCVCTEQNRPTILEEWMNSPV